MYLYIYCVETQGWKNKEVNTWTGLQFESLMRLLVGLPCSSVQPVQRGSTEVALQLFILVPELQNCSFSFPLCQFIAKASGFGGDSELLQQRLGASSKKKCNKNTWLTANSSKILRGSSSSATSWTPTWVKNLLNIQAWCSWLAALLTAWERPPLTGMSGHPGPCPPVRDATLTSADYIKRNVWTLTGSRSKLTGSVVRLKQFPRPHGVSHWVLKSLGCLKAWRCHGRSMETPTNTRDS